MSMPILPPAHMPAVAKPVQEKKLGLPVKFAQYSSENLPPAAVLNISEAAWLDLYFQKKGEERGMPFTDAERTWHTPRT